MTSSVADRTTEWAAAPPLRVSEQVADVLSKRISSGVYVNGESLPAERVLAADLHVHRRTIRTAIDHLVNEGLVSRRPNRRPVVGRPLREPLEPVRSGPERLRISTSNFIALIMRHGGGPLEHAVTAQQHIFRGMNQALTKIGYHAVYLDLGDHTESEEENAVREARHLRYIRDQGFGAALFYPNAYRHNQELVNEVNRSLPLVLLDRKISGTDVDFVGIENRGALYEVTRHLIAQGHRRIAHLTGSQPLRPVQDRIQGYIDAMRGSDMESDDVLETILHIPAYSCAQDRAWTAVDAVFRLPKEQRPTAVACFTDYVALNLAQRLESLGLSVPGDVALTGFDNVVPALTNGIGLTTVAQPYEQIGITAVELLMRRIKDRKSPPKSVELPGRLIERASSSSTPRRDPEIQDTRNVIVLH